VLCATTDGESGSSLKLGSCVDQRHVLLGTRKLDLKFFLMNLCIQLSFPQMNHNLILGLSCALISIIPPPWVRLDLLSMFVLTPFLFLTAEDPDYLPEDVE
jgi:hypothetical protein